VHLQIKLFDSKFIGKKLGQLKLEHDFLKVVFLAYYYGGIENLFNDKLTPAVPAVPAVYIKVKGLKDSNFIDFNKLQKLLIKNNELSISNEKWYRNFKRVILLLKKSTIL